MLLLDALRKSGVLSFEDNSKTYAAPTGFTVIDALGGNVEIDVHGNFILNGGLSNKFYMKTGNSGTGKTTLAIQTCAYGVDWWNRRYPDKEPSDLIVFDSEDNLVINRVVDLTGWNPDYMDRHFSLRKDADIKTIYNTILKLVDEKRKNKDTYFVETDVSAIVCVSDVISIGLIKGLQSLGKRVPEDISVTGYDDLDISNYITPSLTTVHQDLDKIANLSVGLLLSLMMNRTAQRIVVNGKIIIRNSTGPNVNKE